VSATHLPAEEFAVTVHGRASPLDLRSADAGGFRETLIETYVPRYGEEWVDQFLEGTGPEGSPVYARIEADRMFTFHMPEASA
jgi:hypothetical protein